MTQRILEQHDPETETLIASAGMRHLDVPLVAWLLRGGRSRVILSAPFETQSDRWQYAYRWLTQSPLVNLVTPKFSGNQSQQMQSRDEQLVRQADHIEVGVLNPKGRMRAVIRNHRRPGARISYRRLMGDERKGSRVQPIPRYRPDQERIVAPVDDFEDFIWHFTRGRSDPMPGQDMKTYVAHLLGIDGSAPYSAAEVLARISQTKRIVAGSTLIRGHYPVVSFTGATWTAMSRLFHWQSHLRRVRFEPFAVGIRKCRAKEYGFQPVIYGNDACFNALTEEDRWRFQAQGSRQNQWQDECEWRHFGDVDLTGIDPEDLQFLSPDK